MAQCGHICGQGFGTRCALPLLRILLASVLVSSSAHVALSSKQEPNEEYYGGTDRLARHIVASGAGSLWPGHSKEQCNLRRLLNFSAAPRRTHCVRNMVKGARWPARHGVYSPVMVSGYTLARVALIHMSLADACQPCHFVFEDRCSEPRGIASSRGSQCSVQRHA